MIGMIDNYPSSRMDVIDIQSFPRIRAILFAAHPQHLFRRPRTRHRAARDARAPPPGVRGVVPPLPEALPSARAAGGMGEATAVTGARKYRNLILPWVERHDRA